MADENTEAGNEPKDKTPPAPTFTQAQLDAHIASEVSKAKKDLRKMLLNDEDFVAGALEKKGIKLDDLNKEKKGSITEEDLQKVQKQWELKNLSPLQAELAKKQTLLERMTNEALDKAILQAATEYGAVEGVRSFFPGMLKPRIQPDEDTGEFHIKDAQGKTELNAEGKPKTVNEYIREMSLSPDHKSLFNSPQQKGPGASPGNGSNTVISSDDLLANLDGVASGKVQVK